MIDKLAPEAQKWGVLAIIAFVVLWYLSRKVGQAAEETIDKVFNVTNDENIWNESAQWAYGGGSDGQGTIGTDLFELAHAPFADPDNPNADTVFGYLFGGNTTRSLGTDIYDLFND